MTDPLSYERRTFYNEVRDYDASLEPWLKAEYKNLSDAEQAFTEYKKMRDKYLVSGLNSKTYFLFRHLRWEI